MAMYKVKLSRIYRKLLAVFLLACAVLVVFIVFVVFNKAIITIQANKKLVRTDFPVNIVAGAGEDSAMSIPGKLNDVIIEKNGEFSASGTKKIEDDIIGTVKIINEYSQDQPLVATTRLETEDGILLRINERVEVPAGGEVSVQVYADDPVSFNEIQPTQFTIPGLWKGLQDKIYAQSDSVIKNTAEEVKFVQQKDIDRAKEQLTEKLYEQIKQDFAENSEKGILVIDHEILEENVNAEDGEITDQFDLQMKMKVTVVMFDKDKLYPLAGEKIMTELPDGFKLENINLEQFIYSIENYNDETETVGVNVHAEGTARLDTEGEVVSKQKLMGLTEKGAELYLDCLPEIESADVELSPFWVRKIPSFEDHIEIIIVE